MSEMKKAKVDVFLKRFTHFLKRAFIKIQPSLIAILIGFTVGFIVMLIFNPERALWGLWRLTIGGFGFGVRGFASMLHHSTAIMLTGLAVVFAFRTGLFNIGASGQMMVAAFVAAFVGVRWTIPAPLHWMIALLLAALAGMLWGLIPGLLKAFRNVNEVVASIMLNWIAAYLLAFFIAAYIRNPLSQSQSMNIKSTAQIPYMFRGIFGANSQLTLGFFIAIAIAILIHIILYKTTLGFQLRASGFSMDASKYAGMNTKANIISSMGISGALAGLAGGILYLTVGKTLSTDISIFSEGFQGISVALLGLGEPLGAIFSAIFLSHVRIGGVYMQPHFKPEIADMIIGIIIYVTAISVALQVFLKKYKNKIKTKLDERKNGGEQS